ncbi:MAG: hypothetical protein JSW53_04400 [Candidatus Bathyarchaeota archaeon]|nr:MAG: hypothetical protein JSW53_04400 [Candidatus Bathyarchaeota archaeon]
MTRKALLAAHLTTQHVMFTSVFAALHVILSQIPLFYIFGAYGQFMPASLIVTPAIGLVLGPILGATATAIGGIASMIITGNMPLGVFSFLPGMFNALCVGLILRRKRYISAAIFAAFTTALALLPSLSAVRYYVWLHFIALAVLLSPASMLAVKYVKEADQKKSVLGTGILAFVGVLIQHAVGSFIFQLLTPLPQAMLETLAFIYPVERLLATIAATIVGVAIIRGVRASGFRI